MSRREEREAPENHERWMISYADFITLLMIFFVVLYSMSKVDQKKYELLSQSLNITMGAGGGTGILKGTSTAIDLKGLPAVPQEEVKKAETPPSALSSDVETETPEMAETRRMAAIQNELHNYFSQQGMGDSVQMHIDERGLVVSMKNTVLFDAGQADIKKDMTDSLVQIGKTVNTLENYIRIEGHTDNTPINTAEFKSNWELSAVRAINVLKLFIDRAGILPQKLSAVGYGEYKPLTDNSTPENRARNRRVDIIILNSKYNDLEK